MLEMALTLIMVAAVGLTFFVVFDWVRWFSAADVVSSPSIPLRHAPGPRARGEFSEALKTGTGRHEEFSQALKGGERSHRRSCRAFSGHH